ncbi:CHASE3 domain-containing protein [Botrimarina mediterranea]|uniref:histidine kinase n=1 Tax=Botrimarina mediterranea TaxID=2528022 RepID=A0A518K6X7_9BACT|nr:CHASE3 domain-containing protein [Botrimarina mediterranea]QDV73536.1 Aerobic respiration control sensor protein ArcB [Botrimarina mediterranea]QDV78127.1 Aerobic respiration control sensor protein ArcB [Planctomycetes bacterium K2D]
MAAKSSIDQELRPRRFVEPVLVALTITALIVNGVMEVKNFQLMQQTRLGIRASKRVLIKLEEMLSALTEAESSHRGYLFTEDELYLVPYQTTVPRFDQIFSDLEADVIDDTRHDELLLVLRDLVDTKLSEMEQVVRVIKEDGREAAVAEVQTNVGLRTMDKIRRTVAEFRKSETRQIDKAEDIANRSYANGLATSVISTATALLLVGGVIYLLQHSRRRSLRAALAIQAARDDLRVTLSSIGDGVIATDERGRVTFLNAVAEGLTGWTTPEARGLPLEDVFVIINETSRQTVENPATRALREGVIVGLANHTLLINRDGTETPIDDSAAPIRGDDESIRGVVLVFRDVADRRDTERMLEEAAQQRSLDVRNLEAALGNLRAAEERYRLAMDAAELGAWNINPATNELVADERFWRLFTGSEKALDYEAAFAAIHPDDREGIRRAVAAATRADEPAPYAQEYRVVHPDGAVRWLSAKGAAHFKEQDGERQIVSFDGTIADITDRKLNEQTLSRMTADLIEADRRKNEFLATLAHELRNPLAPIKNAVQLLGMSPLDPEVESLRLTMARQVEQLVHLIDDLMDVSRISRGKIALRKEHVDLKSAIDAAVEAASTLIEENGQRLRVEYLADSLVVYADHARLTQVLSNLLNNAAKYSGAGCQIELLVRASEDNAVIEVRDNGVGIEPGKLESIFQMFSQLEQSLERGTAGLGIGLTLVKSFVEMHGGTVSAQSEGRGRGSVFTVTLPLSNQPQAATHDAANKQAGFGRSFKVLIVEDQAPLRIVLSKLLEKMGHRVEGAEGGEEALRRFSESRPEVVFSDISMPGMSGYELVRRLRSRHDADGVYIVAMTGYGQATDRETALEAGFDEHMVKPADISQLERLFAWLAKADGDGIEESPAED